MEEAFKVKDISCCEESVRAVNGEWYGGPTKSETMILNITILRFSLVQWHTM